MPTTPTTVPPHLISALERAAAGGYAWSISPTEAEALLCALKDPILPLLLSRACFDISIGAKAAAKALHARGDSAGGYYNEGRDAAMEWLSYQLLNPESPLMKGLRQAAVKEAQ